jgi:two-component system response regulator
MSQDTILLVEDDSDEAYLATMALESSVIARVVHVRDGAEALDFCRNPQSDREIPVVVLLDLKLPKVSGLEVLKTLRSEVKTRLMPVVVMTNSRADEDVTAAYTNGCNSYVRKQVDWIEFKETIRRVGEYWMTINEKLPRAIVK